MSYTLKGRVTTRLAASIVPILAAVLIVAVEGSMWALEIVALMIVVGLILDVAAYDRLLPYQPGWLALPMGLGEVALVMALVYLRGIPAPIGLALVIFAVSWLVAQLLTHAVLPMLFLSYAEDGGELGRAAAPLVVALVGLLVVGTAMSPGPEFTGRLACVAELRGMVGNGSDEGLACANVARAVGLDFKGSYGKTSDIGVARDRVKMSRAMQKNMGNGAAVGDFTGNGYLDVYLLGQRGHRNRLFRNDPDPRTGGRRFTDVTDLAGVGDLGMSRVAHFGDLNGNGLLDLVVFNDFVPGEDMSPSRIFRNHGDGTFDDVTAASGFDPTGLIVGGASLVDFDGDGLLDIYVSYWTMTVPIPIFGMAERALPGSNRLYRNLGGFRFEDVSERAGIVNKSNSFSSAFADFTRNGYPDMFLARDTGGPSLFYENKGGTFREIAGEVGAAHRGADMGVAVGDVTSNGRLDIYVTSIKDPEEEFGFPSGNALLVAADSPPGRAKVVDRAAEFRVDDTGWGWGAAFVDIDLDGTLDLYAVQGMDAVVARASPRLRYARAHLFLNDGDGHLRRAEDSAFEVAGDQRALVVFDYNRDGAPDFLITQVDGHVQLLENRSSVGRWLTVVPVNESGGTVPGSEVSVTVGSRTTTQVILAGGSYLAGPPHEAYFGLGSARRADEVRVRGPGGETSVLQDVEANQLLEVVIPRSR